MLSAAPRADSAPCSSRGCASPAAGRPDFRFGLCEIGAFSSLLCWFCGLGCGEVAAGKRLRLGPPALGRQKTQGAFWGAPRPRNEKPGAVSRAGLGHTPEGYLFILGSRYSIQKSEVAKKYKLHHAQVVFGIPEIFCWAPQGWRASNEKPGAVSRPGLDTLFKRDLLYLNRVTTPISRCNCPRRECRCACACTNAASRCQS